MTFCAESRLAQKVAEKQDFLCKAPHAPNIGGATRPELCILELWVMLHGLEGYVGRSTRSSGMTAIFAAQISDYESDLQERLKQADTLGRSAKRVTSLRKSPTALAACTIAYLHEA